MRYFIAIALWFAILPQVSFAGETKQPIVTSLVNKSAIFIGETIKYTLTVTAEKNIEIEFPPFAKSFEKFVIKDSGQASGPFWLKNKYVHWYMLTSYETGTYIIPKTFILYRAKGASRWNKLGIPEQKIEVKTVLDNKAANSQIKDIQPPVPLKSFFYIYCILAGILFIGALVFAWKLFKKKRRICGLRTEIIPAHILAYEQLERLKQKNYIRTDRVKLYFDELSDIVRHYLENRFGLRAPEMTSEEFLNYVRDYSSLVQSHKQLLKEFLERCDLVKFAKYLPTLEEIELAFTSAKTFIDQTKEKDELS